MSDTQDTITLTATSARSSSAATAGFAVRRGEARPHPRGPEPDVDEPDDDLAGVDKLYGETMNGKPRFLIVESNLHTQLSDGSEVLLRLDPPAKVFRTVMKDQGDQEDLDQLFAMLELLGSRPTSSRSSRTSASSSSPAS